MNTHETDNTRWEAVSAAMDGEADAAEDWAWMDEEGARARWHCYHIIGDSLRQSARQQTGGGLKPATLAQLAEQLRQTEQEVPSALSSPCVPQTHTVASSVAAANQPVFKWFATAASVVAVSVMAWQLWPNPQPGGEVAATVAAPVEAKAAAAMPPENAAVVVPVAAKAAPAPAVIPTANTEQEAAKGVVVPAVQKQIVAPSSSESVSSQQ